MDALAIGAVAAALIRGERFRSMIAHHKATLMAGLGFAIVLAGALLGHLLRDGPNDADHRLHA